MLRYLFATATGDADPGAGYLRLNNADMSAATFIYVSNTDRFGEDAAATLLSIDDSDSGIKAVLALIDRDDPQERIIVHVTGAITGGVGYKKIPITVVGELG